MLDNRKLTLRAEKILRDSPYEMKVLTFDLNCKACPHVQYLVKTTAPYSGKVQLFNCGIDSLKAIRIASATQSMGTVVRRCSLNEASMEEVFMNGCRFWSPATCENGEDTEFVEVETVEELRCPTVR